MKLQSTSNCARITCRLLVLLFFLCSQACAKEERIFSPNGLETQSIMGVVDYIYDRSGTLTLENVIASHAGNFQPMDENYHSFGYTKSTLWLRFTLDLRKFNHDRFFLIQEFEHLSTQELFYQTETGKYERIVTGEDVPRSDRMYATRNLVLQIPTPKTGYATYYIRVTPKMGIYTDINLKWSSVEGAIHQFQTQNLLFGLYFGSLTILWIYNFFLWIGSGDKLYLYYIYYLGSFILAFFYIDGYANLLYDVGPISTRIYRVLVFASMHGLVLFARHFLALHQKIQWLDQWLRIQQWGLFTIGFLYLFFLDTDSAYLVANILNIVLAPPMLIAGFMRAFRGSTPERIYSVGWTFLVISTVTYVLRVFGVIPANDLTTYSAQVGTTIEALLFSLGLVSRFNVLKEEKDAEIRDRLTIIQREREAMRIDLAQQTLALKASHDASIKANEDKRQLIHKVNTIAETERKNIAVEIHDELNATIIGVKFDAQRILSILARLEPSPENAEIKERAESTVKITKNLYTVGRTIVTRLRPEILDTLGLAKAVEEIVHNYQQSSGTCTFEFESKGNFSAVDGDLTMAVYRLTQEALSNVVKHSKANTAVVTLEISEAKSELILKIADNGVGFDVNEAQTGLGLVGMRERVFGFKGKIFIRSWPGRATVITARFPLSPASTTGN